jgi:hypothetical protein
MKFIFFLYTYFLNFPIVKGNDDAVLYRFSRSRSTEMNYQYIRVVKDYHLDQKYMIFSDYYKSGKVALKWKDK